MWNNKTVLGCGPDVNIYTCICLRRKWNTAHEHRSVDSRLPLQSICFGNFDVAFFRSLLCVSHIYLSTVCKIHHPFIWCYNILIGMFSIYVLSNFGVCQLVSSQNTKRWSRRWVDSEYKQNSILLFWKSLY